MFGFGKKKKEEKNSVVSATGNNQQQNSSVTRRISGNTIEQRIITKTTISNYSSSVTTSRTEIGSSTITTGGNSINRPSYNQSQTFSSFPNSISSVRSRLHSVHEIDATPFKISNTNALGKSTSSGEAGYQSPFSRKLAPYRSTTDARPFNANSILSKSPTTSSISEQSTPSTRNLLHTSYRPQSAVVPSALTTASSTQSLPCSNESSKVRDPRIPTYDTNGKNRGKVLVINNIKFLQGDQDRKGAETDEKNITRLFKDMGFTVDTFKNLKQSAMMDKVKKFRSDSSLKKVDISILVMMSHGSNIDESGKIIRGGFTQIYGIDDVGLAIDDVLNEFSSENCPAMAGKAKIFIFQCCRGTKSETLHNDAKPFRNAVKKHGDMLIAFSTLPGFYSIRDTKKGSWYIECICDVFKKHAKEFDVETLLKIVDDQLSKKHPEYQQTSTYESRGFKCCYLNPK